MSRIRGGSRFWVIPLTPAMIWRAKERYGLDDGSGFLSSTLMASGLFMSYPGILINDDLFSTSQQM